MTDEARRFGQALFGPRRDEEPEAPTTPEAEAPAAEIEAREREREKREKEEADRLAARRAAQAEAARPKSLVEVIAAQPTSREEQRPREQLEAEHAATIGWLFDRNEEKLGRQTDALVAGDPDRREVEGRPPLSLGLPSEPERERDDADPFDPRSR